METAEERDDPEMDDMVDLPSQEILRENLMKPRKKKKKRAKAKTVKPRCPECLKVYSDKNGLAKHMLIHSKENPFWCPQCDYKAKTKQYLARHVKRVHNGPPSQHRCSYCDKAFHFKCALVNHERVHTGAKPYSCEVCGKSFSALYSLNTHKFIHTDEKPFKCTFCEYACRDSSTLRKHKERHLGTLKMWPCDICSKKYDTKCGLRVHMTEVHIEPDVRKYKCEICEGSFKKPWVLKKHIESVHARSKTCVCVVCDVTVPNHNNLKAHMRSHVDVRPFRCASCPTWFKDRDTLKRHGRVHNKQRLICDLCGAGFSRKNLLIQHMKVTHLRRKKTVGCNYCGVRFYTKQYLAKHVQQKHSRKRKKYICDWCDFVTHNKPSIVMHIKYGHNLDKGTCKICGKAYKRERFLRMHYKNTHNLRFKTDTKVEDIVIPETTELKIKEEPLDFPDLEIDLLEIDKEEPFAGFEPADLDLSSALPDVLERLTEKEQTLQEYLDQVMNTSERDDVTVPADTDQQSETQSQNQESNQLPSQITSLPVEVFNKRITEDTAEETLGEDLNSSDKTLTTLTNVRSLNQESNLTSEDKLPEFSQAVDEFATKKEVLTPSDSTTAVPKDKQAKRRKKTLKKIRKAKAQRTPMPVQEFLQKFVGDTQITKHDSVIVDHNSLAAAESRLKELLMKMNRTDSGKVGVMKNTSGKNTIKLFTQREVIRSNAEASEKPQNDEEDKGAGSDKQNGDDDDKAAGEGTPRILKSFWSMHQCYVCFKIFDSKPKLIDHCKEHFDVCNEVTLKKCPLCSYVTTKSDIRKHLRKKHKEDVKISFMNIKEKSNASGSSYYYDTTNDKIKELDIIPSIKILNKKASMEIDKKNRERKNKLVGKHKLVKKGNEWIVEKEKIDLSGHFLPDSKDLDKNSENYLDILKKLGKEAKRKGVKMLYPCNKCDKLCQNLSALTLHSRKHDPNPKPFRPRGWIRKDKEKKLKMAENLEVNTENRLAKPKPVVNNHKCDPKLIDFYENNIKGGDIEFWQFLKIYNKMDRDHVNSFEDLQVNHEYGMHNIYKSSEGADSAPKTNQNKLTLQNNSDLEEASKVNRNINENIKAKSKNSTLIKDGKKIGYKGQIKKLNNKFVRTVQLSKLEHDKRMEIKRQLREKILAETKS